MLCCEVTRRGVQLNLFLYKALHHPACGGVVCLQRFPALRLRYGRVRARRAGVRIPSLRARGPCQIRMRAQRTRKFLRILANFGSILYIIQVFLTYLTELPGTLYELCTNSVRTLHEFRGIICANDCLFVNPSRTICEFV